MQLTSIVFCVLVVVGCNEVRIHGAVEPTSTTEENTKFNGTKQAGSEPGDNNFIEWFLQILGQRPSSTAAPFATDKPGVCPPCKCGFTNTQRRIVGGVETKTNQYPWMAQMLKQDRFYCGATVINSGYVVTAAHCIDRFDKDQLTVRIGDHDRSSNTEAKTIDFKVDDIIRHSGYSTVNYNNDIALVKLRGVINFVGPMRPVCLAERGLTYAGKNAIVTGWGAVQEAGPTSNTLLEVSVPIMTNSECRAMRYPARRITDNMMCAGYTQGGKDSCQPTIARQSARFIDDLAEFPSGRQRRTSSRRRRRQSSPACRRGVLGRRLRPLGLSRSLHEGQPVSHVAGEQHLRCLLLRPIVT